MHTYSGLYNNNGFVYRLKIHMNIEAIAPYETCCFLENECMSVTVNENKLSIGNIEYNYKLSNSGQEMIIVGSETPNFLHYIFSCFYRPIFFVLSNKQTV